MHPVNSPYEFSRTPSGSRNLHPQKTNNVFLQSENHGNHYHHLRNVTFPQTRADCWVDIFHRKTNNLVAVCVGDAMQTALFFLCKTCGWFSMRAPSCSQSDLPTKSSYSLPNIETFYIVHTVNIPVVVFLRI